MIASGTPPRRWQADLALASIAFVWGATFVIVKRALLEISTLYFLSLRFALGSFCLFLIFLPVFRKARGRDIWKGLRGGATAGLFLWLGFVFQSLGLKFTTAGNSGFLTGLYIVLVPLISAAIYRRWPLARELIGIFVATAGMVVLTLPSLDRNFRMNKGDLLTLGCAVAFAFHLIILGYYSQREQFEAVALGQIGCAATLSGISLVWEPPRAVWSTAVILAIVITALLATALAFALQTWAQQYTTPTRTALVLALEPVFALATAVSAGGETLTISAVAGGALILMGILTVELKPAAKA